MNNNKVAIYIHWPFCKSKCPYCDFNSHVREKISTENFERAYLREIEFYEPQIKNKPIRSIFFGGGTPSLMNPSTIEKTLSKIDNISSIKNAEITLEANPTSIEAEKFREFKNAGVNRVSIGIQSFNEQDLKFLGREHSANEAIKALEIARETFSNFSFDLIYARPGQKLNDWLKELEFGLSLSKTHLSLYQLTIEKGTPFYAMHKKGEFEMLDEEALAEFYIATNEIMKNHQMPNYEVSNYAKKGFECQHNLQYWEYGEYIGIGAGAHGRIRKNTSSTQIEATQNIHHPENWLKQVNTKGNGLQQIINLTQEEKLEEFLLFSLRLIKGMNRKNFKNIFGADITQIANKTKLEFLVKNNFLEITDEDLCLTDKGYMVSNKIISELL